MSDNQNIAGSMYRQTKGIMEPEKEREAIQLSSTAADIVSAAALLATGAELQGAVQHMIRMHHLGGDAAHAPQILSCRQRWTSPAQEHE